MATASPLPVPPPVEEPEVIARARSVSRWHLALRDLAGSAKACGSVVTSRLKAPLRQQSQHQLQRWAHQRSAPEMPPTHRSCAALPRAMCRWTPSGSERLRPATGSPDSPRQGGDRLLAGPAQAGHRQVRCRLITQPGLLVFLFLHPGLQSTRRRFFPASAATAPLSCKRPHWPGCSAPVFGLLRGRTTTPPPRRSAITPVRPEGTAMGHAGQHHGGRALQQGPEVTGTSLSPRSGLEPQFFFSPGAPLLVAIRPSCQTPWPWNWPLATPDLSRHRTLNLTLSALTRFVPYPIREEGSRQTLLHHLAQGRGPQAA